MHLRHTEAVKTLNYISTQSISDSKAMGEIQDFSYSPASDRLFFRSYLMTDDSAEYYFNSMKSDGSDFRSRLITDDRRSEISFTADGSGYYVSTVYNDDGQTCTLVKTDAEGFPPKASTTIFILTEYALPKTIFSSTATTISMFSDMTAALSAKCQQKT